MNDFPAPGGPLVPGDHAAGLWLGTFASGLRLVVREDHRTPVAVVNAWVKVGSNREPDDLRGWSHGIEHMLFKGTDRRGESDFAVEVAEAGGSTNAGTGYETTNYHIVAPAGNLDTAVDILGDALFHSTFAADALDAEREVLVHENHMYDDRPFGYGVTWRWALERALDVSPYRHPIGGRDENLRERSRDDIMAFWRSAYRPENMVVVVVGDVEPGQVQELVASRFPAAAGSGPAPVAAPRSSLVASPPVEPAHDGTRLRRESGDIQKAYAKLVFPAPGDGEGRRHVLSVVRRVLGDGRSCRLYRRVQEDAQLVDNFVVMVETGPREGLVIIDLETSPDRLASAVTAVARVLGELGTDGCTEEELKRARARVLRSHLFGAETVQGQAGNLGHQVCLDDLAGAFELPQRVATVSAPEVAEICRRVFRAREATLMVYLPRDAAADDLPATDADAARLLAPLDHSAPAAGSPAAPAAVAPAAPGTIPVPRDGAPFSRERLSCGVEVCWRRDTALPVVAAAFTVRGGATAETRDQAGLAALTQAVQVKGAGGMSAAQLHEALEGRGAALAPHMERDATGLFMTSLASEVDAALDLTAQVIHGPDLADDELERERRLALEQLASLADNPFQAAAMRLRELLYGDHPYGRPLPGTPTSLSGFTRADLVAQHARAWNTEDLQVVVGGDIDPDRLLPRLESLLAGLPPAGAGTVALARARTPAGVETARLARDQKQSVVLVGWPGAADTGENRVPLMMWREVLNGQSGRLFEELRNRRSLCYNTGVLGTAGFGQGMLVGYVLTAPESAHRARETLVTELLRTAEDTVPANEFERARTKLLGNLLIAHQAGSALVSRAARDRLYGRERLGLEPLVEAVTACTADQVRDAAAFYLDGDGRYEVECGPDGEPA